MGAVHSIEGLIKWVRRDEWRGSFVYVVQRHVGQACRSAGIELDELAEAGIEPSVGSVGNFYDNALAKTINGLQKAEVVHQSGPWTSFEAVEFATLAWVDRFNHRRLMGPIGNMPPAEAEERC